MGRLIKPHLGRLIVLTAATCQVAAAVQGFIWPKVFWDFLSKSFDEVVKPVPILQTINLLAGLLFLAWEWPFHPFVGMRIHRSIKARLLALTFAAFAASLLYQATDAAMYYIIGIGVYSWAYYEGDDVAAEPWAVVARRRLYY